MNELENFINSNKHCLDENFECLDIIAHIKVILVWISALP